MASEVDHARGIRIAALMQSPGWPDLVRLLSVLKREAVDQVNTFTGWDKDQKSDLMARQQAVAGVCDEILKRLNNFLLAANEPLDNNPKQPANLAQAVETLKEQDSRIPGTY